MGLGAVTLRLALNCLTLTMCSVFHLNWGCYCVLMVIVSDIGAFRGAFIGYRECFMHFNFVKGLQMRAYAMSCSLALH